MSQGTNKLLQGKDDQIDYNALIRRFPWIVQRDLKCVLSPDSDGLLCGLFMAKYFGWTIVGFYDDKVALINREALASNPIFLDGEIFRSGIRSMGHHMLTVNHKKRPVGYDEGFQNCIQPNLLRCYDKKVFQLKYPLATIHMLVSIAAYASKGSSPIAIPESAIPALFFTDGVYSTMFDYTENVLNWLHYLRIDEEWNPLKSVFENDKYSVHTMMIEMNNFFKERDKCNAPNQRGDRLRISHKNGDPCNINGIETGNCHIAPDAIDRICRFMRFIGHLTSWEYIETFWECWTDMQYFKFTKGSFKNDRKSLTIENFNEFIKRHPLSWAMTSGTDIEYTIEEPARFAFNVHCERPVC